MSATIVTCLFDLAGRESSGRRSAAEYLRLGGFLFGQSEPLICFTDPALAGEVRRRRAARGLENQTLVVSIPLEEMPRFSMVRLIEGARRANPILNLGPEKDTPLYTFVGWSKSSMLRRAATENPFGSSHFVWVDLGIAHMAALDHVGEDGLFRHPSDRLRLLMLRNWTAGDLEDRKDYFRVRRGHVAAGLITGDRAACLDFCDRLDLEVDAALAAGFAPLEEAILPIVAASSPDRFEFHYGDYSHILENYRFLRGSAGYLLNVMRWCRDSKDFGRSHEIGRWLVESHRLHKFACEPALLSALLDEAFMAAFYDDYPSQESALGIARYYVDQMSKDRAFLLAFRDSEEHIRSNFGFLRESPW
jgi:hypothetical protein